MSKKPTRSAKKSASYRQRKRQPLFRSAPDASALERHHVDQFVQNGLKAYKDRRISEAAEYLTSALAIEPTHALANNCLGIVRRIQGDLPAAIACYQRAISTEPQYAEAQNNLGVAFEAAGDMDQAIAAYEAALLSKPDYPAALNNLGNTFTKLNRVQNAVEYLSKAVEQQPRFAAAHNNLGLAYSRLGNIADAERSFEQALQLQPKFPEACSNLGNLLRSKGNFERATEYYNAAISQQPRYVAAHIGLGNVLYDRGRIESAQRAYEYAIQLQPISAEAHFGLGNALSALGADGQAIAAWKRALEIRPDYPEARNNLGSLYYRQGYCVLAEKEFSEAVRVKPNLIAAHNNLGNLYREQDRMDLAAKAYAEVLNRQPSKALTPLRLSTLCPAVWNSNAEIAEYTNRVEAEWTSLRGAHGYQDLPDLLSVANEPPYNLQFLGTNIRSLKEAYANIFRYTGPTFRSQPGNGRIKLGFVVTPSHEVAFLRLIWGALRRLNSDEFERTIVCTGSSAALFRSSIRSEEASILEIPEQPHKVLHSIRERQFDLLHYFEICTDSLNYFLPFFRLAPVQVTSWGIQVTSGIQHVDAYLSSDLVEAAEAQDHYTETLYRADTLLSYQEAIDPPAITKTRESFGFGSGQHLYFCVQHVGKFHPDYDEVMAGVLRQDPVGIVVMTEDKYGYSALRLRERFQRVVPDVAARIVILPRQGFADYLSLAAACDVMLDPIHFSGVSTTYDCLSLNKPIVTWPSAFHRGRYTLGCYKRMGMLDCVATSADEYVQMAVKLASDAAYRDEISKRIGETKWHLFEDRMAISEHERLFRELVQRSRQQ
jgi:protein O-GlcNAc transferase